MLQFQIELHNHSVRAARQADAGADVVLDSARQLALQHREDVVLLLVQRIVVVDQAERAVELEAR